MALTAKRVDGARTWVIPWARQVMSPRLKRIRGVVLALLLAGTTLAVYWQVRHFEFTNYDDEDYVTRNAMVRGG